MRHGTLALLARLQFRSRSARSRASGPRGKGLAPCPSRQTSPAQDGLGHDTGLDAPLIRPARAENPQLQTQDAMRTLLLHNPKAGDGTPDPATLQAALSQSGCSVHYRSKEDDDWKSALGEDWDLIVI